MKASSVKRLTVGVSCLAIAMVMAACAPAAGQQATPYLAMPQEVIATIAQIGSFIETPSGYDYFSIETIGERYITLIAPVTTGWQVANVLFVGVVSPPLRVTVTTFEQAEATSVAISVTPVASRRTIVDTILTELDRRFRRAL